MGYVRSTLAPGEHVEYEARFHWLEWLCAIGMISVFVGLFWTLRLLTTEIVLTNRRLILKRGIIARNTEELSLNRMEETNLNQGVLGRLLVYGKVTCHGTGRNDITTPTIANPMGFQNALQRARQALEKDA